MFSMSPYKVIKRCKSVTLTLSLLGAFLSAYSVYVSYKKESDKEYKAFCDISDEVSCSKIFTSKYGKGFGLLSIVLGEESPFVVSNGIYGIAFYILVILLGEFPSLTVAKVQRALVILTNFMSLYLGYILFFVLKDKCVVCIATYVINFLIGVSCFLRVRYLDALKEKKKGKSTANKKGTEKSADNNQNAKKQKQKQKQPPQQQQQQQQKQQKQQQQKQQQQKQQQQQQQQKQKQQQQKQQQNAVNKKKNEKNENASNSKKGKENAPNNKKGKHDNASNNKKGKQDNFNSKKKKHD